MRKKIFARVQKIALLIIGTFYSCVQPNGIPKDLYIKIEGFPSQPGAGGSHVLTLLTQHDKSNGRTFEWTLSIDNEVQRMDLPDSTVQKLVDELRRNRVFRLNDRYADYDILDGGTDVLTIRMNAREKIIHMDNESPKELAEFFRIIYRPQTH